MKRGDLVEWYVRSKGREVLKKGQIFLVVPKGFAGGPIVRAALAKGTKILDKVTFGGGNVPRDHESYLVIIMHRSLSTPSVYWPDATRLTLSKTS